MTPPRCLMACHHEPIQKLVRSMESIFEHQAKRLSCDRNLNQGILSSWELIFESAPYKINQCSRVLADEM
jgi:hypothetical protein